MRGRPALFLICALVLPATHPLQAGPSADLILTNARVYTGDPAHPEVEAIAVLGERIAAAGPRDVIAAWRGPATRIIDAAGRRVVPGFNDAHVHFVSGGMDLCNLNLKKPPLPYEMLKHIAPRIAGTA